eukprot:3325436-Prymnesium_polylepis.1
MDDETSISKEDLKPALDGLDDEDDDEMGTQVQTWQNMTAEEWNLHGVHILSRLKNIREKVDKISAKPEGGLCKSNQ